MKNKIHKLSWAVAACCSVLLMTSGCDGGEDKGPKAIVVWNPFVIATLASREDVRVLFDSTKIPNEIVDSVGRQVESGKTGRGGVCLCRH